MIGTANRWYPVLLRYITCLTGRINGGGGDASKFRPLHGYQLPSARPGKHARALLHRKGHWHPL